MGAIGLPSSRPFLRKGFVFTRSIPRLPLLCVEGLSRPFPRSLFASFAIFAVILSSSFAVVAADAEFQLPPVLGNRAYAPQLEHAHSVIREWNRTGT